MQKSRTTIALLAAAAAGLGGAGSAVASAPKPDAASGQGYSRNGTSFAFTVKEQLGGRGPSGRVSLVNPNYAASDARRDRAGGVVCANIDGGRALIGFRDRLPNGNVVFRQLYVEDHGTAANGHSVDRIIEIRSSSTRPASTCGAFPSHGTGRHILAGDIDVTDRANGA